MRRNATALALSAVLLLLPLAGCTADDDGGGAAPSNDQDERPSDGDSTPPLRFCDVYLDYLSDSTPANLEAVAEAAEDEQIREYAEAIASEPTMDALLAATLDLDDAARSECQSQWVAGTQGAGNTPAAAQAFLDALVAGDRAGAQNVASSNALAVFDPWEPIEPDDAAGTPTVADVGGQSFSLVLDPSTVAQCEVQAGVVVACQRAG